MNLLFPIRRGLHFGLALLALLQIAAGAPIPSRAQPAAPAATPAPESEPNNSIAQADFLNLQAGPATILGKIDSAADASGATGDWYSF